MTALVLAWDDGYAQEELVSPALDEVTARLAALNGVECTLVTVYRGESHLAVGGAAADGLVVYATIDNEEFWQLLGQHSSRDAVVVVAGGQAGSYPARHVVDLKAAVSAATSFVEQGVLAPDQDWEAQ